MAALHPSVAAVRTALFRMDLDVTVEPEVKLDPTVEPESAVPASVAARTVLVACSGGADSMALAAAAAFVGPRRGWRTGLVTVDHQLQPGSAQQAAAVAQWAAGMGLDPVVVATVDVGGRRGGPEAAARHARYEALVRAAHDHGAGQVLLGHTRDDQAETVLLALLRGAGGRGLAGMPRARLLDGVALVRPLLNLSRAQTQQACAVLGLVPWADPHNDDPAYARTRARALVRSLAETLGPAVVPNLARTAQLAAADETAWDRLVADALAAARDRDGSLVISVLADLPHAVRSRLLHRWVRAFGVSGSAVSHRHIEALNALVVDWHGQGAVHLPGARTAGRVDGRLRIIGGDPSTR